MDILVKDGKIVGFGDDVTSDDSFIQIRMSTISRLEKISPRIERYGTIKNMTRMSMEHS